MRSFVIIGTFSDNLLNFMSCYRKFFLRAVACVLALTALVFLVSCGTSYNNATSNPGTTSKFKHRIYVTNAFAGTLIIFNADNDQVYGRSIVTLPGNDLLTESHDGKFTLSYSNGVNVLYYIDNSIENVSVAPVSLTGNIETLSVLSDNVTAVTASRNAPVNGQPNGAVFLVDLTNRVISSTISVPLARFVSLNHAGTKVLAFADNTNAAYVIDT